MCSDFFKSIPVMMWCWIAAGLALAVYYSIYTVQYGRLIVRDWAKRKNLTLVSVKSRTFVPFFGWGKAQYFRIKVMDADGATREGWLWFPSFYPGLKDIEVKWDEST